MNQYQYYSDNLQSNVTVSYIDGLLHNIEVEKTVLGESTPPVANFIISEYAFLNSCKRHNKKYTLILPLITFEMFWERYKHKVDRVLAQKAWDAMTREDQVKAYNFIPAYQGQLKNSGLAPKYPVRYLKHRPWVI